MSKEHDENNRRIANWLEPLSSLPNEDDSEEIQAYESDAWIATLRLSRVTGMHVPSWEPRDFYADEAANALVLDRLLLWGSCTASPNAHFDMRNAFVNVGGLIDKIRPSYYTLEQMDRKTAIVLAAMKLIESEEK